MTSLETAIKRYLEKLPECWFIKTAAFKRRGRWGIPDFIVCHRGIFYAFEAKSYDDEPTELQKIESEKIQKARGIIATVRSVKHVQNIIEAERRIIIEETNVE